MKEFTAKIVDPIGLHARPTSIICTTASKFKSDSKLFFNGREGNLKSIMNIMALGIKHGAEITIKASGDDEDAAISAIKKAFEENQLI
ncbi:HPr family phosphocarrier protein [Mycoplasmopsis felis]|uniref:HPr family phosphocarrier protein n=1 Tax=Mycoplasmopsis felis TaxID=33923 RepID=UPI00056222C5|nr:HPr family phosphocarrier protein [Mycoplasmopsis felis]WQQ01885.1 HPr family phosphocarrier protein [Mycoplasmopsis felis]WQQ03390.1 HPr family phosphocarrier protein [Mycoplasmopsis felis]WQQ03597.1 HPr family phosphocarrier protein [Mycoplasmopsis felis]WQQ05035.1 HPr family phosphocarrier protein [Mycoplasmopsis felis]WQQ06039.1 HPr family phosphocarrier protein [Mycoplasmopsis felis]